MGAGTHTHSAEIYKTMPATKGACFRACTSPIINSMFLKISFHSIILVSESDSEDRRKARVYIQSKCAPDCTKG